MPAKKRLVLIDGANYAFRAFHALPPLTNRAGQPTGALFGFAQLLARYLREDKPDYIAVVWDAPGPTFRHLRYAEYKAQRKPMDPALRSQMPLFQTLAEALNMSFLSVSGVEADDVIATLALQYKGEVDVEILSTDKDLMQIVGGGILMLDTIRKAVYDPEAVEAKWGVPPSQIRDFLALMGDKSDNVPGVPGVGKKRAADLLKAYGTVQGVYQNIDSISGKKLKENLVNNEEIALLSQELVTLKCDVPLDVTLEDMARGEPDVERCRSLFERLEFHRLLRTYGLEEAQKPIAVTQVEGNAVPGFLDVLAGPKPLVLMVLGGDWFKEPTHIAVLGLEDEDTAQVLRVGEGLPWDDTLKDALQLALSQSNKCVGYQIKSDIRKLFRAGLFMEGKALGAPLGDVLLSAYVAQAGVGSSKLEDLCAAILHVDVTGNLHLKDDDLTAQIGARLHGIRGLYQHFEAELAGLAQGELLHTMELPLVPILAGIEHVGIDLDVALLNEISQEIQGDLTRLHGEICAYASREDFNPNSPKQLQVVLFEELGLPIIKRTKTGPSTNSSVLEALSHQHPLPRKILNYRSLAKLNNTYLAPLPSMVSPETARIHTTLNQAVAATGRLSSSDPNLQNIPVRTALGRRIREAFIVAPGSKMLSADYSQVELRLMAHLSGDEILIDAFLAGQDIHSRTAAELYGLDLEAVTPEVRRTAKSINFGILYGMGAHRLAQDLDITRKKAQAFIDQYFERFSGVRRYLDDTIQKARDDGYVETIYGRRRYLPEIHAKNFNVRANAERMATNAPLQGSAADIIKLAMIKIDARLREEGVASKMLLQVHDELLFEVPEQEIGTLTKLVQMEMEGVAKLKVPLSVEVGLADNWAGAH